MSQFSKLLLLLVVSFFARGTLILLLFHDSLLCFVHNTSSSLEYWRTGRQASSSCSTYSSSRCNQLALTSALAFFYLRQENQSCTDAADHCSSSLTVHITSSYLGDDVLPTRKLSFWVLPQNVLVHSAFSWAFAHNLVGTVLELVAATFTSNLIGDSCPFVVWFIAWSEEKTLALKSIKVSRAYVMGQTFG